MANVKLFHFPTIQTITANTIEGPYLLGTFAPLSLQHSRLFKMMKPTSTEQLNYFANQQHIKSVHYDRIADSPASADANTSDIGENDVLCGRGGLTNSHIGNKHYRQIVQDHQAEYLKARKRDKILIAQRIVAMIQDNGGRFLKRSADGESWVLVTDKKAQEKASQALREGLDVCNKKIRPSKQIRRDDDSVESDGRRSSFRHSGSGPGQSKSWRRSRPRS